MRPVNKLAIATAFGRAAAYYDNYATLQRYSGEKLLSLISVPAGGWLLDAGCGTGYFSTYWKEKGYCVVALDLSETMLQYAQKRSAANYYLSADIEQLPFKTGCFDLIFSNLTLQWCNDLRVTLLQMRRVTSPNGSILFSIPIVGSLAEVNKAWHQLDNLSHVNSFLTIEQIEKACQGMPITLSYQSITLAFTSAFEAMYSLKGTGATWLTDGRQARGLSRFHLRQLEQCWPQDERGYLLTWHLLFGVIRQ